jgi:preprotein translocase SecE subunit
LEKIVAEKQSKATSTKERKGRGLLRRRIDLPAGGRLGRNVRLPRWLRAIGGYFIGSWRELREVSWPTRKATWGMTFAVILFTLGFTVIILLLDLGFELLLKRIIL